MGGNSARWWFSRLVLLTRASGSPQRRWAPVERGGVEHRRRPCHGHQDQLRSGGREPAHHRHDAATPRPGGVGVAARGRRPPATAGGVQLLTAATLPTCRSENENTDADSGRAGDLRSAKPTVTTLVRLAVFRLGEVVAYFEDHANHLAAHGQADPARDEKKEIHTRFLPLSVKLCCWSFASPGTPRVGMHRRVVSAGCRRRFVGKSPWQLPREKSQSPRRFHR